LLLQKVFAEKCFAEKGFAGKESCAGKPESGWRPQPTG
jgi:hypothetical protein